MQRHEKENLHPTSFHPRHCSVLEHLKGPLIKKQAFEKPSFVSEKINDPIDFISSNDSEVCVKVLEWFSQKKVMWGNPEEIIERHTAESQQRIRQLSGNGPFLPRLNILDSKLIRKRGEKEKN